MGFAGLTGNLVWDGLICLLAFAALINLALMVRTLGRKRVVTEEVVPPQEEMEIGPEIRPLPEEGELRLEIGSLPDEGEGRPDIRPLLGEATTESCQYCAIFKDLGTMVCPHCGRPLNIRLNPQKS